MAGIDRIYLKTYKAYKELLEWAKKANIEYRELLQKHGIDDLSDYIWQDVKEDYFSKGEVPICNNVRFLDVFFIKFCPIQEVQDRLKIMYGESYKSMQLQEDYKFKSICTRVKVIYPYKRKVQRPIGYRHCFDLEFETSEDGEFYALYNDCKFYPITEWCGEKAIYDRAFTSVKAAIRFLLKASPSGLTFTLMDYGNFKDDIILKTY